MTVYLCDLDPASSYRNLIVVADEASDDYVATVLHPEGDALVIDRQIYGLVDWDAEADAFISYENTGLFGSNSGTRHYYGDAFEPDTEWLTCWMPSEEYLKEYRQNLFEGGYLLHLVRDLPCTVDGQPAILTAGNCILLVRYHESLTQAEVRTEDGSGYAMPLFQSSRRYLNRKAQKVTKPHMRPCGTICTNTTTARWTTPSTVRIPSGRR